MLPYSGLKIVHDQQIQETLERYRPDDGQGPHRHGLRQTVGKMLARFSARPASGEISAQRCHVACEAAVPVAVCQD